MVLKKQARKIPLWRLWVLVVLLTGLIGSLTGWLSVLTPDNRSTGAARAAGDPVIAAAGDIACDPADPNFNGGNGTATSCRQKYTANLLVNAGLAAVLDLGDNQYECGGYQAFLQSYNLSWGLVKSITHPVVGNHEYLTSGGTNCTNGDAAGYFQYFGASAGNAGQGYYSYNIGNWHLIALNSNCSNIGGCTATSPEGKWLDADLAAHPNTCTLAYWHIPFFSSGGRAALNSRYFWQTLYNHHADVILNGHDHIYERFAPQTSDGVYDPVNGIRQFTVGTGGANHTSTTAIAANSVVINTSTYGVLKLTLHAGSYDWQFVPEAGGTFKDSGTAPCHNSPSDTTPPTTPGNLTATTVTTSKVQMSWTASTDNVGVVGYQIFRGGSQIGTATTTSYTDTTVQPQTTYSYYVTAIDAAGNSSNVSNTVTVTTKPSPTPTSTPRPSPTPTPTQSPIQRPTVTPSAVPPSPKSGYSIFLPMIDDFGSP